MLDLNFDLSGLTGLTTVLEPPQQPPTQPSLVQQSIPKSSPATSRQPVYIDIETIPDESRRHLFGLDEPVAVVEFRDPVNEPAKLVEASIDQITEIMESFNPSEQYLANLEEAERTLVKKPRAGVLKIIKAIRLSRQQSDPEAAEAAKSKKMSLSPEMCRIVCIGIQIGRDGQPLSFVTNDHLGGDISETDLIEWAWDCMKSASSVITFNGIGFDLPGIMARSILLGVRPTRQFDMSPWKTDMIDLMVKRFPKGCPQGMGLKQLCKLYGIEPPAGDVDGSEVGRLFREDPKKLVEYNLSDIFCSVQLHKRFEGFFC